MSTEPWKKVTATALDHALFGDCITACFVNAGGSQTAKLTGPALGDQNISPAVAIDTFNGDPYVLRDEDGNLAPNLAFAYISRP